MDDALRYPLGMFFYSGLLDAEQHAVRLEAIRALPEEMRAAVNGLTDAQLDTPYRDGGWSPRQLVHHITDASTIFYSRTKLILTEDAPHIKSYDDEAWMKLADYRLGPAPCLLLLSGLHEQWSAILDSLGVRDRQRTYVHSQQGEVALDFLIAYAAWHGRHHTMQITALRNRQGW